MSKGALNGIRLMYSDTQMNIFRQTILLQGHLLPPSACVNTHSSHTPGYQMTHAHRLHKVVNRLYVSLLTVMTLLKAPHHLPLVPLHPSLAIQIVSYPTQFTPLWG